MQHGIDVTNLNTEQSLSSTMINYELIMSAMDSWEKDQILPLAVIVKSGTDVAKIVCDTDSLSQDQWELACLNGAFLEEMTGSRKVKIVEGLEKNGHLPPHNLHDEELDPKDTEFAFDLIDAMAENPEGQTEEEIEFLTKWVLNEWKKLDKS